MRKDLPLVCPFCDELAYTRARYARIFLPNKIYTPRECIMGHTFYSVEEIPEDQDAVIQEIAEIRKDYKAWRREVFYKK